MKRFLMISIVAALALLFAVPASAAIFNMPAGADLVYIADRSGSRAGYAVAMGDLNNDGVDDLIIGAPTYTDGAATRSGRVHVIWGGQDNVVDLTLRTSGNQSLSRFYLGSDVAVGDINGDGIDDLLASAPPAYRPAGEAQAGIVFVVYGRSSWSVDEIVVDPYAGSPLWADVNVIGEGYDFYGTKLASGDLNDDGFDDIIGSEPLFGGPAPGGGRVTVVYGGNHATNTVFNLPTDGDLAFIGPDPGMGFSIGLGNGLAAGDVTGDGIDDLLMGGPGTWNLFQQFKGDKSGLDGEVYVEFGSSGWTQATPVNYTSADPDVLVLGVNDESNLGYALAVGDVNGDDLGDIIMGAPFVDPAAGPFKGMSGTVFVIYGNAAFPATATIDLNNPGAADITINGELGGYPGHFGFTLATGDMDGDCIDDILVGSFYSDNYEYMKAYTIYGSDTFGNDEVINMAAGATHQAIGAQDMDFFGFDVAMGDADGDMLDDMLIGAPNHLALEYAEGAAYLIYSPEINLPPVADAGVDQYANVGDLVTLDGSGSSDPEGLPITYAWNQVGGPSVTLNSADTVSPDFTVPDYGTYTFALVVNDCLQDSDPDEVQVFVEGGPVDDDDDDDDSIDDDEDEEEVIPGFFGTGGCGTL